MLREAFSGWKIIIFFSAVQSAHCSLVGVNGLACSKIFHEISYLLFSLLSFQMWELRVVPLESWWLKLKRWPEYLSLKVFAVNPT